MSILTELPEDLYAPDAFRAFTGGRQFSLADARTMIWMSQLAYEADADKIGRISSMWRIGSLVRVPGPLFAVLNLPNTETLVAATQSAVIVAFAGTDPVRLTNWITNLTADLSARDTHRGFDAAVEVVWQALDVQIGIAQNAFPGAGLIFTGHSLGGALAVLAAERALAASRSVTAVYTFGMPRVGGHLFAQRYGAALGDRTYRLRYGQDIVPCVPTTAQGYHHVGRYLYCASGKFADLPAGSATVSNEPDLPEDPRQKLRALLASGVAAGLPFVDRMKTLFHPILGAPALPRSDLVGVLLEQLPPPIRDHVPHRYYQALA